MFRWNLILRTRFGSSRHQSKARRRLTMGKPQLEELTPRILPSASSLPAVFEASPPIRHGARTRENESQNPKARPFSYIT
jgi:hypothetical protein